MNLETGSTDTAKNWASEAISGEWDCPYCQEEEEHDDEQCSGDSDYQFSKLIRVKKTHNGHYQEVK